MHAMILFTHSTPKGIWVQTGLYQLLWEGSQGEGKTQFVFRYDRQRDVEVTVGELCLPQNFALAGSCTLPEYFHLVQYLLLFPFLLASSIFFLFYPFPFYQNSPTAFPGRMSQEATEPGFSFFCVDFVLYVFFSYGCMVVFVVFDSVLSCGVIVVSPFCRRQHNILNEPLNPFSFWVAAERKGSHSQG